MHRAGAANRATYGASVEAKTLADLKIEKGAVEGERRTVEADLEPVQYLATLLGQADEVVLRCFILIVAFCLIPPRCCCRCHRHDAKIEQSQLCRPRLRSDTACWSGTTLGSHQGREISSRLPVTPESAAARKRAGSRSPSLAAPIIRTAMVSRTRSDCTPECPMS